MGGGGSLSRRSGLTEGRPAARNEGEEAEEDYEYEGDGNKNATLEESRDPDEHAGTTEGVGPEGRARLVCVAFAHETKPTGN